jgi:hypothetical protein
MGLGRWLLMTLKQNGRRRPTGRRKKLLMPIVSPGFRVTNFCFFDFLAEALKKNTVCPVVKKRSRQIANCGFLFEQS